MWTMISSPSSDGQLPKLQSYALALWIHWMVCHQSVLVCVQGMRFCGHEGGASWEQSWHATYVGKRTQKYSKDDEKGGDIRTDKASR